MNLLMFRCQDCDERLSDYEVDILDFMECRCETCYQKQLQALKDILPEDYYDDKYGDLS